MDGHLWASAHLTKGTSYTDFKKIACRVYLRLALEKYPNQTECGKHLKVRRTYINRLKKELELE